MSYIPLYEMSFRQLCKISSRFVNLKFFRRLKDILATFGNSFLVIKYHETKMDESALEVICWQKPVLVIRRTLPQDI